ncbi:MAG: M55 family metallopeptidase [Verrucomicrobiae bacterium]|nr:M55 family metallopeptidase [Verrucomicrobiae bacterium]
MKVYIQTDIEGVAGMTFFDRRTDSYENFHHRQRMRRLLTGEVNAAVKGAFAAGAKEVVVNDNHGCCYSILFEELDPRCEILHGRANTQPFWLPEIDQGFDVMLLVGMHAMGGTLGASLPHSKWTLNDGEIFLSEASMAAALAGCHGIRAIFISGDQYITREVGKKVPGIITAVVKKSLGPYFARSRIPAASQKLIFEGVKKAMREAKKIKPLKLKPPFRLNLLESKNHAPPFKKILKKDVCGNDLVKVFQQAVNAFPWNNFGQKYVDDFVFPA